MNHHRLFPASYSVEMAAELPPARRRVAYLRRGAQQGATGGMNGPLLRITAANREPWLACFAGPYQGGGAISAVYATPDPEVVCVVSGGAGYWINTATREKSDIPIFPVRSVEAAGNLLLFANFTRLAAYGPSGLTWLSESLVSDRLALVRIDPGSSIVECRGWDPIAGGREVTFRVNLKNGQRMA